MATGRGGCCSVRPTVSDARALRVVSGGSRVALKGAAAGARLSVRLGAAFLGSARRVAARSGQPQGSGRARLHSASAGDAPATALGVWALARTAADWEQLAHGSWRPGKEAVSRRNGASANFGSWVSMPPRHPAASAQRVGSWRSARLLHDGSRACGVPAARRGVARPGARTVGLGTERPPQLCPRALTDCVCAATLGALPTPAGQLAGCWQRLVYSWAARTRRRQRTAGCARSSVARAGPFAGRASSLAPAATTA